MLSLWILSSSCPVDAVPAVHKAPASARLSQPPPLRDQGVLGTSQPALSYSIYGLIQKNGKFSSFSLSSRSPVFSRAGFALGQWRINKFWFFQSTLVRRQNLLCHWRVGSRVASGMAGSRAQAVPSGTATTLFSHGFSPPAGENGAYVSRIPCHRHDRMPG